MCDCFHLAFPNWHAASSGTGAGRRLRGPEPGAEDDSTCDEPSQFTEGERPRPQGSSPVEEYPETEKYSDSDKECEAEHDPHHKSGSGKKTKKSGLGSMFEKRSTPKMSKLKEVHSPESGVIVKTAKDGCAEGLVYGGGGKEGIFIKEVVPESPASKSLKLKEGDQVLSATVYFDNVSYEDAIQILEHAQAYKVKLCLKRKPDITETEPAIGTDVIPEEELYAPEMREQGKTKRRGDARISWPKFPSFGKGRKSRFTRSHSSSEADEQRKLELSPTTSDTESPIKSQDALKGKKRHKIKLSVLTKRGRISSSEDQDTDTPTTGQISGKILQTHETSDMLSPECLESPSGKTPEVYVTEDLKVVEDLRLEQNDQKLTEPQTVQHKVELITIDSTLKTTDLTVALADKETSSGTKSPDGKKKKKERSELKIKILGKDKLHKKDTKEKSSPKRLKTLGASIETPDQPENEKSDVIPSSESHTKLQGDQQAKSMTTQIEMSIPKVELNVSDVAFIRKSPQKGDEKTKKHKEIKEKQETKTGPIFKLPKIGFSDIATEETIQKMNVNVEECTTKIEQLTTDGTKVKEDPYEQLSSRTQLPKREEIEIPGMEDMSKKATAKAFKEPKAGFIGHYEELQAEAVQLSIDVDSVKEAVSKLPGYKLPQVDMSGVPIPEEITVIDANAQRISVKTPTKVVDTKTKHETHFTQFDVTASPEVSKTTVKLPKLSPADLTSEELLIETKVDLKKTEKKYKTKPQQSDKEIKTEVRKREDIIIPGKESVKEVTVLQAQDTEDIKSEYEYMAKFSPKESEKKSRKAKITTAGFGIAKPDIKIPDIGIDLPKQNIIIKEVITSKTETRKGKGQIGGDISDVKIHEIDSIEYIDSVGGSPPKFGAVTADISVNMPDADKDRNIDGAEIKTFEREGRGSKFKMPNLNISMPKVKGPKIDTSQSKKDVEVILPEAKAEVKLPEVPKVDVTLGKVAVAIPEQMMEDEKPELEIKPLQTGEFDGKGGKFKMPKFGIAKPRVKGPEIDFSLSKKDVDVTLPEAKAEVKLPDVELKEPSAKVEIKAPEFKGAEKDVDGSPSKFKMPTFKLPKFGGATPNVSVEVSDKTKAIKIPETQLKPPEEGIADDINTPNIDIEGPSLDVKTTAAELDGKGSKFKMPKFGISMPKVKGPEINLSMPEKDVDVTLPDAKAEVKLPDVEHKEPGIKVEVKAPEIAVHQQDVEGSPSKFKMPTFKLPKFGVGTPNISVKVPDVDKDMKIDGADMIIPEEGPAVNTEMPSVDFEGPSIDMKTTGTDQDAKGNKFKMPHLGFSMPKVKGPKIDLSLSKKDVDVTLPEANADVTLPEVDLGKADVSIPEGKMEVKKPELEIQSLQIEGELGQEERFKMPKFGLKMPKVKGPEFDLSSSKKDTDVTLPKTKVELKLPDAPKMDASLGKAEVVIPEAKAEFEKPDLEMKPLQTEVEGQGSKFKMPKFGIAMPKVKGPEFHLGFSKKDIDTTLPEAKADINLPDVELKEPEIKVVDKDTDGSKFKMPSFSVSMPKVKGPDTHLSKKDTDSTLPGTKAEVTLQGADASLGKVQLLAPEAKLEVKEPKVEIKPLQTDVELEGQGGKFKMPKFGITMPKVKGPEIDLSFSKKDVDVTRPGAKAEVELPEAPKIDMDMKPPECEADIDGQGTKFKVSKFGISLPKIQGPEIDVRLSKKDVHAKLPEAKAEVRLPDAPEIDVNLEKVDVSVPEARMEVKKPGLEITPLQSEGELDGQGSKFKMPKFGMSMPKVKGPEIDLSLSKKDVDIKQPEAKADVSLPDVELKGPSAKVEIKAAEIETPSRSAKESPSKFKMPTFKFPKFGVATPNVSTTVPDIDEDAKIDGADMHITTPHMDVDVPEVKAEVQLPEVEMKEPSGSVVIEQPGVEVDAKMKKSRFSLPKFSFSKPSVKAPDVDVSLPDVNVAIPEAAVEMKGGKVDMKSPEFEADIEGQGSKFKMPKFGITMPKVAGPEIDLSLPKKDVDMTLPEATAEVKLPDVELKEPSAEVEIKAPEIKVATKNTEESPSKFKMPTFKLPKFGVGTPSATVEVPDMDKDVKIDGGDIKIPEEVLTVGITAPSIDTEGPSIHMTTTGTEKEGKGSKFKMPSLGFSVPQVKQPDIDLSLSKKDVDVTLPEATAEVKLPDVELKKPSAEVEIKAPEIKVATKNKEESPSKFKMPTFKLPKFGVGTPSATVEVPDMDKDVKIDGGDIKIPEEVLTVGITAPSTDTEGPSIHMTTTGTEKEGKGSKFKMPSLGFSVPQVKQPDIDLSLSKKDVDVTLPQATAEVKLPDAELKKLSAEVEIKAPEIKVATKNKEESPSKFKMPTFKLPKFGVGTPSATVEVPDMDKDVKIDGGDIKIPEEVLTVAITAPSIDTEGPSIHMTTTGTEKEGKGSKFKMPSLGFSVPQAKRPDIDLSLSKKDVDVTLPEATAEVKLPDVELKKPSAEVEIKAPEIKVATKNKEESPSKFKMPTFKLPKFGVGTPSATVEVPDMDKDVKIDGGDIKIPEEVLTVAITAPSIDTEGPSIHMTTTGTENEGKGSKFKMPSLGFSVPQVKRPDIDLSLSKKDVDVTLPEAKAEVKLPDVELQKPSTEVEIKAPGIDVHTSNVDGSPSKFKMPTFKLPKFGVATPQVSVEVPDDKDIRVDGEDLKLPQTKAEVKLPDVEIKEPVGSISVSQAPVTEGDAKVKKPRFSLPKFSFSKQSTKEPIADVNLPDVDVSLPEGEVKVKQPEVELKLPESDFELDGQGSKFKMPKFGISMPKVKGPEIDLSLSRKDVDVTLPEAKAEVQLPDVKIKQHSAEVEVKAPEIEVKTGNVEGSPSKLKMPTFTLPKFGAGAAKVSVEVPDVDKDVNIEGAKLEVPKKGATVEVTAPSIDTEGLSVDVKAKGSEAEGSGSKFKLPSFGISMPKVKGPEIDISLSKKDVNVTMPEAKAEVKLPSVKVEEPQGAISVPDAPTVEGEAAVKRPSWTFPKFSFSKTSGKAPDVDVKLETPKVDVTSPEAKADVSLPDVEVQGPSGDISIGEPPAAELDANLKKSKFSLSRFSFSKSSVKEPEVSAEIPHVDVSLPEGQVKVKHPDVELKPPEGDAELDVQESKFKMPKFGISIPKVKSPEIDLSLSRKDVDVTLPEAKAEVQLPDVKIKQHSAEVEVKAPEIEVKTGNVEGSPSKLKMPTFTLPKFGAGAAKVSVEVPDVDKDVNIEGAKLEVPKKGATVEVTAPSIDTEGLSVDVKAKGSEAEGSGSKFKLPSFGISMPKVKGPEIDISLSKKDVNVTMPEAKAEVKLPSVKVEEPEGAISIPDAPTVEGEAAVKRPSWTFPKFSFSKTSGKAPDVDVNLETPKGDVTSPEAKAEVSLPDVEVQGPSGDISIGEPPAAELDANLKKSKFSLPRFSFSKSSVKEPEVSAELPHVDVSLPEGEVKVKHPDVELKPPEGDAELDVQGSKFKMPKFGISIPKVKSPEIDLSLSRKDVDVTLPEAKAEVQLPDVKIKQHSAEVEVKAPEIEVKAGNVEGSPSKLKMPTFTLPKFGAGAAKVSVEVPDVDKDVNIEGAKLEVPKKGATVEVTAPSIDTEGLSVDVKAKGSEAEGSGSKFKLPSFGISMPKVKGPEIDISLSKKEVDVTMPEAKAEVKLPSVKVEEPEGAISVPDAPTVEGEAAVKRPSWTFPKFSFSKTSGKAPDVDVNLETPKGDVTSPEAKADVSLPDVEVQGPSGDISIGEPPAAEVDANLKKSKFSLSRFSFSKSSVKEPEVSAELPHVDVSLPEGEVKVKHPEMEIKAPELEAEHGGQENRFKLPKFGIALPKPQVPEDDINVSKKDVDISLPEVKAEVKLPEIEVKSSDRVEMKASETEAKSKDVGGSPLKFKMPTVKMPKFGGATYDVTVEGSDAGKVAETDGSKLKEDMTVKIKGLSVDIKPDESKASVTDTETPKAETDSADLGSPSKFKLPSFRMPKKLSFSRPKPEDEYAPVDTECREDQPEKEAESKGESKSPKMTLTSFGEILKNIDVEFDVSKQDKEEENLETDETGGKQLETKEKETTTKQSATKSPERTGWFKFPRFGLSSPSEPAKISEKDKHKDEKSPVGETMDDEVSPTCSVQSSDAFADISSAMTSEHVGLSISSPTKVTVKYSDPNTTGLDEMHSNIITSTTRTELISVEPNLPEKITILSSGVSSSSEDTLRLESGKIHVITSNIQATPEAQHAKLLTALQIQSAGGPLLKSEANEAASWSEEDSQSGKRTVFERHLVTETSSEISESKETIVITKQITRIGRFDSSEPISGETASSIQRLRDSVHSEKMRFFDGAEK